MPDRTAGGAFARAGTLTWEATRWGGRKVRGQVVQMVGGPARARVIFLFACVLALNSADIATIGAVAPQLEESLGIGNAGVGLLSSVTLLVGAIAVIPVGMLVDRTRRVELLAGSIMAWSAVTFASGLTGSYVALLLTRVALGATAASAGPAIASLTGDYFPSRERGRIYAYILGGEIGGTAVGFIVSGTVASLFSWRWAFFLLAIPGFFLARELWRTVPEPRRGGQSRLERGVVDLIDAVASSGSAGDLPERGEGGGEEGEPGAQRNGDARPAHRPEEELAHEAVRLRGVQPNPALVLHEDPQKMSLSSAVRYILSIPTNMLLIIGSALGYFFLAGLSTFAVVFVRGHYHASQATATLVLALLVGGSLIGTLVSGRLTDAMLRRGKVTVRVWVPAVCYMGATALLIPGILGTSVRPAVWFDVAGAALLSAANPPLDAARLDIVPSGLWGRAESVRTFVRSLAQALAPLLFGGLADVVAGFVPEQAPIGTKPKSAISDSAATGLEVSFLVMLSSLALAGLFMYRSRNTYPVDVATAAASTEAALNLENPPAQAADESYESPQESPRMGS